MDAIVIAGGIPQPQDSLYTYSHGDSKALIDVAGKPMVQWVLDALGDARQVDNVIVIGLSPKSGVTCKKPLYFVSNQGRMLANIVAGVNKALEIDETIEYVLIVSSDIPALKGDMVDWLVDKSMETHDDIYYGVCTREVMEKRFPDSKRTYTRLKDIELCGSDINISHVRMATEHLDMWESLIGSRKSPLRQASMIGLDTFFQVLTRTITLDELVEKVSRRLGIHGRAIRWQVAEPCMDVDKPHQLELLRADMANQQRKAAARARAAARRAAGGAGKQVEPARKKQAARRNVESMGAAKTKPKAAAETKPKR